MADINTATTMANYYTEHKPQIRGRTIYIQFSNHEQLKTESSSQVSLFYSLLFSYAAATHNFATS